MDLPFPRTATFVDWIGVNAWFDVDVHNSHRLVYGDRDSCTIVTTIAIIEKISEFIGAHEAGVGLVSERTV